jgi:hypothetical protein
MVHALAFVSGVDFPRVLGEATANLGQRIVSENLIVASPG